MWNKGERYQPRPGFITIDQAAIKFEVGRNTIQHWIKKGTLKAVLVRVRGARQVYEISETEADRLYQYLSGVDFADKE